MIHGFSAGQKGQWKKRLSLFLCLAVLCNMAMPVSVSADDEADTAAAAEISAAEEDGSEEQSDEETQGNLTEAGEEETEAHETVSMPAVTFSDDSLDGITVTINAPEGAFAEGVKMVVSGADADAFAQAVVADCTAANGGTYTVYDAAAAEISFYDADGNEIQPAVEVEVTLSGLDLYTGDEENDLTKYAIIYHMDDDGNMEYIADDTPGESSYTFMASSFSTYGVVIASVEYETNLTASGTIKVYWDTITKGTSSITALSSTTGISSVTISGGNATNNGVVAHADGTKNNSSYWTATTASITRTNTTDETVTLTITPADGYYVTYITICCTTSGAPTGCQTFQKGEAFNSTYSIADLGVISIQVPLNKEEGFYHNNGTNPYFVLIAVAKIPSPLYVEYDYGTIVDSLNTDGYSYTAFSTADGWTATGSGNNYGTIGSGDASTNGVMTDATQYKYTYADNSDSSFAGWTHNANSITDEAIAQAAAAGYYFIGWQATYYTTCTVTTNASGSYNNYTYAFSTQYGTTTAYYQPGEAVPLTVHVQLVAQWEKVTPTPGTLTITKSFEGLDTSEYPSGGITVTVTSSGGAVDTVTLNSTNNWTATVSNLNPGTYTVTETDGYTVSGYTCTTYVDNQEVASHTTTVTLTYTTSKEINSNNTYTYTVNTTNGSVSFRNVYMHDPVKVTIQKQVSGNMGDTNKSFSFSLRVKDTSDNVYTGILTYSLNSETAQTTSAGTDDLYSFVLSHSDVITFSIPYGYSIEVSETDYSTEGYTTSLSVDGVDAGSVRLYSNTGITSDISLVFTNERNVSAPTGLIRDIAPYALMLGIAMAGTVLMFVSRRRRV